MPHESEILGHFLIDLPSELIGPECFQGAVHGPECD